MIKKIYFLFFVLFLVSCQKDKKPEEILTRQWSFEEIVNQEGKKLKQISVGDSMLLLNNNTFQYGIKKENISASGIWKFKNDTLTFTYTPKPQTSVVDSIIYQIENGKSKLKYFENGKKLAENQNNKLAPPLLVRQYSIQELTENQLIIEEKGILYKFQYQNPVQESNISFSSIFNGLIGIFGMLLILFLLSNNKRKINWRLVGVGVFLQIVFAILVLKVPFVKNIFDGIASFFVQILSFTDAGIDFLFGSFVTGNLEVGLINFVIKILPTIIFFAALSSLFYYWGILQRIVKAFAWVMKKTMRLSGAESLAAAGNIFLGQTESPLLIKPYLDKMTKSEIMALMTGGMATIAGGVLAAYIGFLGGSDPVQQQIFASHLLSASIMSAPASLVAAKMLIPETENFDKSLKINKEKIGSNVLDAISNGTSDGLRLAINVGAMLLVFTALMAMLNYICKDWIGDWTGLNETIAANTQYEGLTLQYLLGQIFAPIAWLIGVRGDDLLLVGQLLGEKTILNEFFAYVSLGKYKAALAFENPKSVIIATYALCGFANFASIGIQIGGIGAIAPGRRSLLSSLGVKALIGGTIACLMTGAIAGMLL